jgi:SAM-dependent methyltransferase
MNLTRKCPLCSNETGKLLGTITYALFDDSPLQRESRVVACERCGFIFYDNNNSQKAYDDFYKNHYYMSYYKTDHQVLEDYFGVAADIIHGLDLSKEARICDIGCGNGELLVQMRKKGFRNCCGVDYHLPKNAFAGMGIEAIEGSTEELPVLDGSVGLFLFSQVFEHLLEPSSTIEKIRDKLSPNGLVYLELPDPERYAMYLHCDPLNLFIIEHINHFDLIHLHNLFARKGFSVVTSGKRVRGSGEFFPVPVIYTVVRKGEMGAASPVPKPGFALAKRITSWFQTPQGYLKELLSRELYIWGISYKTMLALEQEPLKGCSVKAFLDSNPEKHKKTINGMPISSPEVLKNAKADSIVCIAPCPSALAMYSILYDEYGYKGECLML